MARRAGRMGKRGGESAKAASTPGKPGKPGGLAGIGGKPKGQPVKKGLRRPPPAPAAVPAGGLGGL